MEVLLLIGAVVALFAATKGKAAPTGSTAGAITGASAGSQIGQAVASGSDTPYVSPHFTWLEATNSTKFPGLVAANQANARYYLENIRAQAQLMEQVRVLVGPCVIHSWFRDSVLNAAVGGVATSDHLTGLACDFHPVNMSLDMALAKIAGSGVQFKQLLIETGALHISWGTRHEVAAYDVGMKEKTALV